jgi:hypothetical protein
MIKFIKFIKFNKIQLFKVLKIEKNKIFLLKTNNEIKIKINFKKKNFLI